ncbi:MAG TPA: type II methionyl aminopeptidase [Methanocorpusculum sp.]|nr:type II methionyl aminopeptidase [Methanocorpusculum sp.]
MDDTVFDKYIEAGKIAKEVLSESSARVKPGVLISDIFDFVLDQIEAKSAKLSFPPNISLNNVAAHDTASPIDDRVFKEGDVVKLDIGTHIDGYIADTSVTVDLGDHNKLCEAAKTALDEAIKVVKPGTPIGHIGYIIESTIESYGYQPIRNLTGHSISRYILHDGLSIPNIGIQSSKTLEVDQVIAIEPFATTGSGIVHETNRYEIYQVLGNNRTRTPLARKILAKASEMKGLPFSRRWLKIQPTDFIMPTLIHQGNLYAYPCLEDIPGSIVSQFEHTMIVTENGATVTTQ